MELVCLYFSEHDFLTYNDDVALVCSDFRSTSNSGIHRLEARALSDEEVLDILEKVADLPVNDLEDRLPTKEELFLLEQIKTIHPEVRYIVEAGIFKNFINNLKGKDPDLKKNKDFQELQDRYNMLDKAFGDRPDLMNYMSDLSKTGKLDPKGVNQMVDMFIEHPGIMELIDLDHQKYEQEDIEAYVIVDPRTFPTTEEVYKDRELHKSMEDHEKLGRMEFLDQLDEYDQNLGKVMRREFNRNGVKIKDGEVIERGDEIHFDFKVDLDEFVKLNSDAKFDIHLRD